MCRFSKLFKLFLLDKAYSKFDKNKKNKEGKTALYCLVDQKDRNYDFIKLLLDCGADPNIGTSNNKTVRDLTYSILP